MLLKLSVEFLCDQVRYPVTQRPYCHALVEARAAYFTLRMLQALGHQLDEL